MFLATGELEGPHRSSALRAFLIVAAAIISTLVGPASASAWVNQSVKITKAVDKAQAVAGESLIHTIVVSDDNSPTYPIDAGTITDVLPATLTPTTAAPNCTITGQTIVCAVPQLEQTGAPGSVVSGGKIAYTIAVTNAGTVAAVDVQICDTLPAAITLQTLARGRLSGGQLCWSAPRLAAGAHVTYSFTARVDRGFTGTVKNVASAEARNARRVLARSTVTAVAVKSAVVKQRVHAAVVGVTG